MSENIEMPKFFGIPTLAELYSHSREMSEKLVCDESTIIEHRSRLEALNCKISLIEGNMWVEIGKRKDASGKPLYTNESQRNVAYENLKAVSKTDSASEEYKEYKTLWEEVEILRSQIGLLTVSIDALRRTFSLNIAVIRAMSGYFT